MLAFTTYLHGKGEIAITTLDGKVKKLTHNMVDDFDPVLDARRHAYLFTSGRSGYDEVYMMSPDWEWGNSADALPGGVDAEEAYWPT